MDLSNFRLFDQDIFTARFSSTTSLPTSRPALLSFPKKFKNIKDFAIDVIHFSHFVSAISLQRNVVRPSAFQVYCFKNFLPL